MLEGDKTNFSVSLAVSTFWSLARLLEGLEARFFMAWSLWRRDSDMLAIYTICGACKMLDGCPAMVDDGTVLYCRTARRKWGTNINAKMQVDHGG